MTYWVESRTPRQWRPFVLERRLRWGGGRICLEEWRYRQKGRLFVPEACLPVFASKGAVVSKRAIVRARQAPSLAGGAPYLFRRTPPWVKRTFFVPKGRLCRREGRHICLEWRSHVRKGHPFVTEGAFDGGMGAVSVLKGAVTGTNGAFCDRRAAQRAKGRRIGLKGRRRGRKVRFCTRMAPSLV